MDRYDPSQWNSRFAKNNEKECLEILEAMNAAMKNALSEREYLAAAQCCNKLCDGLICMVEANGDRYAPMFYAYSFILSQICMFGIGGERGLRAAIPPLQDAYEYAEKCSRNSERAKKDATLIGNVIEALKNGYAPEEVKEKFDIDFPENIIG